MVEHSSRESTCLESVNEQSVMGSNPPEAVDFSLEKRVVSGVMLCCIALFVVSYVYMYTYIVHVYMYELYISCVYYVVDVQYVGLQVCYIHTYLCDRWRG